MYRAFTSATTRVPRQTPRPNIQAPSNDDDEENNNSDDDDEEDIGQQSVDESEARSTTDKPKISSDFIRPGSVDKVFPPPAKTLEMVRVHHASLSTINDDKLILEVQVPQNTHPSQKPVQRDKSEGTTESKPISRGKRIVIDQS